MHFAILVDGDDRDPGCETSHGLAEIARGNAHAETCTTLPRQTQRKLNLTWVEYRAGRPVRWIRRTLPVELRCSRAPRSSRIIRAEIRRSIACVGVANVDGIHQVESFRHELEMQLFINWDGTLQANINGLQCISLIGVARLVAYPV